MSPDTGDAVRFVDERIGAAKLLKKALRYIFPDHWSFLLGEVAMYSFLILVITGTFLAFFYTPDDARTVWQGPYPPLNGLEVSRAYASVLDLSWTVPGGLLMRQTHHWAANLFFVAIVLHVMRTFFTGSFRKPRELTWMVGVAMLALALPEGYAGYSMVDDLLSGMGLAIGYGVGLSIPLLGGPLTVLLFGGPMPGGGVLFSRLFILHVFVMPVAIGSLIALHLILIMRTHHAQFPGPGRRESNVVGTPMWPGYALRSLGLFAATAGALFAVGGLVQINPIWEWGPYEPWLATNGAQPDWYLGWLIGALRLVPGFDVHVWGRTLIPNPFWGGALFPGGLIGLLFVWPWIERWWTRDRAIHHLLDRPRDSPRRTAIGVAVFVLTLVVQVAGSTDRIYFALGIDYQAQIWAFRAALFVAPALAYAITRRICADLRRGGRHPLRGVPGSVVRRNAAGGFDVHDAEPSSDEEVSVDRVT